ncbi:Adenylate kinase 7 [Physocladia obscura]|uniref:Adenylate kinase 7 n=1 Tax=Physocladia obscura TaxID=109957 RepID=A0AAD5TFY3_9FUNG|nr:Adenylate kinase 7 [Physocladia obscura]
MVPPRCFISNVDNAVGYNFSRLLASTVVGSRKEPEPDEDDSGVAAATEKPDDIAAGDEKEKEKDRYQIVGTLSWPLSAQALSLPGPMIETGDKKRDQARREAIEKFARRGEKPAWVLEIVQSEDKEILKKTLVECDVIIYDLNQSLEEASWAIEFLSQISDTFVDKPKTFIALSSIMTWAKTKIDQDDPEAFLAEDEYRRRKPHTNYKTQIQIEKNIMKFGKKSALKTYVIASGLIYHAGDSIFHHMLKSAWHNEQEQICYGDGTNIIPTIHLDDLTNIIVEVVEFQPESKYLLAIDDSKNTLYEITKAISDGLGSGKVKKVPKEMALLNKNLPQSDYDMLLVNLRLEPGHVKEMTFEWKYELGIIDNLPALIQEYKDARGLSPLKIVLHGPPASGKTFYANKIAEFYDIHYVEADTVVKAAVAKLERRVAEGSVNDEDDTFDSDKELLEEIKETLKNSNGKYPDEMVMNFLKEKLRSMPCRNQGYVLDGFPTTVDEASTLFKPNEDDNEKNTSIDEVTGPEFVITLEVCDDFVKDRMMNLPEIATADSKNSEENLIRRLEEFRNANTDENTVLNYFDELEIHPFSVSVRSNDSEPVFDLIRNHIGKPHNYGPTLEQLEAKKNAEEEAKAIAAAIAEEERKKREKEEEDRQVKAVADWNTRMDEIRKQEQEVLEAQSVPLRNYLMKFVMPILTSGLIEVCKVRPEPSTRRLSVKQRSKKIVDKVDRPSFGSSFRNSAVQPKEKQTQVNNDASQLLSASHSFDSSTKQKRKEKEITKPKIDENCHESTKFSEKSKPNNVEVAPSCLTKNFEAIEMKIDFSKRTLPQLGNIEPMLRASTISSARENKTSKTQTPTIVSENINPFEVTQSAKVLVSSYTTSKYYNDSKDSLLKVNGKAKVSTGSLSRVMSKRNQYISSGSAILSPMITQAVEDIEKIRKRSPLGQELSSDRILFGGTETSDYFQETAKESLTKKNNQMNAPLSSFESPPKMTPDFAQSITALAAIAKFKKARAKKKTDRLRNLAIITGKVGYNHKKDRLGGSVNVPDGEIPDSKSALHKFNSCSTLFIDSTLNNSDLQKTLHCVATALAVNIRRNNELDTLRTDEILSEKLRPLSKHIQFYLRVLSEEDIYKFLDCIFQAAELNVECAVITLVYIERMLINTGVTLHLCNWARIVLGGLLLASKVWDDHAVWNADFCQIFPDIQVADLLDLPFLLYTFQHFSIIVLRNELERWYMSAIKYNVSVKASVYARYYFELRDLLDVEIRIWTSKPLTADDMPQNIRQTPAITIEGSNSKINDFKSLSRPSINNNLGVGSTPTDKSQVRRSRSDNDFVSVKPPAQVV